jgi:hypothetical protein
LSTSRQSPPFKQSGNAASTPRYLPGNKDSVPQNRTARRPPEPYAALYMAVHEEADDGKIRSVIRDGQMRRCFFVVRPDIQIDKYTNYNLVNHAGRGLTLSWEENCPHPQQDNFQLPALIFVAMIPSRLLGLLTTLVTQEACQASNTREWNRKTLTKMVEARLISAHEIQFIIAIQNQAVVGYKSKRAHANNQ